MSSDEVWRSVAILASAASAKAVAEVHEAVFEQATHLGRSGIAMALRAKARELLGSPVGRDQIRSRAFEAAADDIAWGRPPLAAWTLFALDSPPPSGDARASIRAQLPSPADGIAAAGAELVPSVERTILSEQEVFEGIRSLDQRLKITADLQEHLWDDPRIGPTPETRLVMQASVAAIRARLCTPEAHPPEPAPTSPSARVPGWRKLFTGR